MGQLMLIDEDEYNDLKIKSLYCEEYRRCFETIEKELYSDYISVCPVNNYQYDTIILGEMKRETLHNRKKWRII